MWLENIRVVFRAPQVLLHHKVYAESCGKKTKKPACASYSIIENAVRDPMLSPKLTLLLAIAEELQPFMGEFQTESPMFPFFGAALEDLFRRSSQYFL